MRSYIFAFAILALATSAWSAPGDFDTTFDGDGISIASEPTQGFGGVAVQADDKIVGVTCCKIYRFATDGTLDPTFDGDGIADLPTAELGYSPELQIAGSYIYAIGNVMVRYDMNGTLDTSYGGDGFLDGSNCGGPTIVIEPSGRFLGNGSGVSRCNSDGTRDLTFGTANGNTPQPTITGAQGYEVPSGMVVQEDGKIVVLGHSIWEEGGDVDEEDEEDFDEEQDEGFARGGAALWLLRFNADGTRDLTFSGNGQAVFAAHDFMAESYDVFEDSSGRIVAIGSGFEILPGDHDLHTLILARFTSDGERDATFGDGGLVRSEFPHGFEFDSAALDPQGRVLISGLGIAANGCYGYGYNPIVVRFNTDGTLDRTFAQDGLFNPAALDFGFDSMTVDSLGRIVLGGGAISNACTVSASVDPAMGRLFTDCTVNGVLEPGEECDDGDASDTNGCTNLCAIANCHTCTGVNPSDCAALASAGTACDDGNFCTGNDQCDAAGVCAGGPQPMPSCADGLISKIGITQSTLDEKDKLSWNWAYPAGGQAWGNPLTGGSGYTLCIFDSASTVLRADLPAGERCGGLKQCWKADGYLSTYTFVDKTLSHDGILKASLSPDNQKIQVKGKGPNLPDMTSALVEPVTVQLIERGKTDCFEATFEGEDIKKSTAAVFKASRKP